MPFFVTVTGRVCALPLDFKSNGEPQMDDSLLLFSEFEPSGVRPYRR